MRRRFTPAGLLVMVAMFMSAGIGVDTNQAIAYQGFSFLAFVIIISMAWALFPKPKFTATRLLPKVGTAGSPLTYTLVVRNLSRRKQGNISVWEDLGDPRPTLAQFANTPEPGEEKRNAFDRLFRFYRWTWMTSLNQIASTFETVLPILQPNRPAETKLQILPKRRGILRFTGFTFAIPDPFGLTRAFTRASAPQSILILPKRYPLPDVTMPGQLQYQIGGVNLASSVGESEEFVALREYRRGDPPRHIHWKSVSKTGKLIVKEFQNEFFVRHALILDTFLTNSSSNSFEEAVSVAASFAWSLHSQESLLDLLFVGPEAYCFTAGRGVGHVEQMLEILASVSPCTTQHFAALESAVLRRINDVSGCICILLDWDEPRKHLVEQMKLFGVPLKVLVIVEPGVTHEAGPMAEDAAHFHLLELGKIKEGLARL